MSRALADLVDLAVQLQRDAGEPQAALHQRDRALVSELRQLPAEPRGRLRLWLEQMRAAGHELPGRRVGTGYRLLLPVLALLGAIIGGGAASVVFHYDGMRPVNVVHVLAVFVAAQLALLLLLGVVMLPASWLRWIPGALSVQEALAALSPGQAIHLLRRRLPGRVQDVVAERVRKVISYHVPFEAVWKWAAILAAQGFALGFNLGALATSLYLVTFSDLAFAWSTTLRPDVERVHGLTQALAVPWGWLAPAAVPSPELIRSTLYYRHEPMSASSHPEGWGGWWPFLVAAMVTYGAFPRVLLLAWSAGQLRRQLHWALAESPGAALVLERLGTAWVATQATAAEPGPTPTPQTADTAGTDWLPSAGALHAINWGGLALADDALQAQFAQRWHRPVAAVHHAGGSASLAADEQTIATVARALPEAALVLLVKGWEPPLLDCLDFLQAARAALGPRRWIVVVPVVIGPGGAIQPCAGSSFQVWQRRLRSLGDPALEVRAWPTAEEPTP